MDTFKRRSLLALLALPTGCAIQYLPPLASSQLSRGASVGAIRPPALGQSWTYQKLNFYNSQRLDTVKEEVVDVAGGIRISRRSHNNLDLGDELQPAWGQVTQDPYWDFLQTYEAPMPLWLDNFAIGTANPAARTIAPALHLFGIGSAPEPRWRLGKSWCFPAEPLTRFALKKSFD